MATTASLTVEDFERLPDDVVKNHELVNGELVDVSGNTLEHNALRDLLVTLLVPYVVEHKLGKIVAEQEFDFGGNVHGPDVSLIGAQSLGLAQKNRRVQLFVPDLAIEIVSSSDTFIALTAKTIRYRNCGTKEVWVLEPQTRRAYVDSAESHEILDENGTFSSPLIPGFSMRLGDLFDGA